MPATTIAVASMMKDEGPYILEWIAWHRMIGISRFFIADNGSSDGMSVLLKHLHDKGIITRVDYPETPRPGVSIQSLCYAELLKRFRSEADWIAFIDADEFIHPRNVATGLADFVGHLSDSIGAVAMNWKTFGSGGRTVPGFGTVTSRFSFRGPKDIPVNTHYKTLVRTDAAVPRVRNPHRIDVAQRWRSVDMRMEDFDPTPDMIGRTGQVTWGDLWIDHFIVKSEAEFWAKKVARGIPLVNLNRDEGFFRNHASFPVYDPLDGAIHEQLMAGMRSLKDQLADVPEATRDLDLTISQLTLPAP